MSVVYVSLLTAVAVVSPAPPGLTLADVLQRARAQAPALAEARASAGEARALLRGASPWLAENPLVEAAVGRRSGNSQRDLEIGVSQPFEIAGQRGLRLAAARAVHERAEAGLDLATRQALRDAAGGFYRVLHAEERLTLAKHVEEVAGRLMDAAQTRSDAGDIAALDLNLARIALGRARAETATAESERLALDAELRTMLGMRFDEPLGLAGNLRERPAIAEPRATTAEATPPEVAAAAAELRQAEAELDLGRRGAWPGLGVAARYVREAGTPIVWGGVTLTLPVFRRGQEEAAAATARVDRARTANENSRRQADTQVRAALGARDLRDRALRTLDELVIPAVDDNDRLAQRSFEVGELGLAALLLVRREGLEARRAHLDALLAAALNDVEVLARTGGLR